MRLLTAPFILSVAAALAACGGSSSSSDQTEDLLRTGSATNSVNAQRFAILEGMLPSIGRDAANQFSDTTGTARLGRFKSADCKGPKRAEAGYAPVSLGECEFVFENAAVTTTLRGLVSARITLPGMPDIYQPNDPATGQPRPATKRIIDSVSAADVYVVAGKAPEIEHPFDADDDDALKALAEAMVTHRENAPFEQEDGACHDMDDPGEPPASASVKSYCYTYLADRWHGELALRLQVEGGKVTGVRAATFGGYD